MIPLAVILQWYLALGLMTLTQFRKICHSDNLSIQLNEVWICEGLVYITIKIYNSYRIVGNFREWPLEPSE